MRKPNLELNRVKLEQKKLQLAQIKAQLFSLQDKVQAVSTRYNNKLAEISEIETVLSETVSTPAVSE